MRSAVICGAATGLGLAIGLEALLFHAALAERWALRFLVYRTEAKRTEAYGLSLAASTALAFLAQTPPVRWMAPACDALGWNLLLGAVTGGLLLALAALLTAERGWAARLLALVVAGAAALGVYLWLDPNCLHGPFADVNPAIRPFWLDHVNEVKPLKRLWKSDRPEAVTVTVAGLMGAVSWLTLGLVRERRRDPAWPILGLMLALAILAASSAIRMRSYMEWFAAASLSVAAAEAAMRAPRLRALAAAALGALFSPAALSGFILVATGAVAFRTTPPLRLALYAAAALGVAALLLRARRLGIRHALAPAGALVAAAGIGGVLLFADRLHPPRTPGRPSPPDVCFNRASYAPLAHLPAGVALSEIDLGPFVLAHTSSSTMSAPYHRMSWGILKARGVLIAPADDPGPDGAHARARALNIAYVLECPVHRGHADRDRLPKESLQAGLDRGEAPAWLASVTAPDAGLRIYRIR